MQNGVREMIAKNLSVSTRGRLAYTKERPTLYEAIAHPGKALVKNTYANFLGLQVALGSFFGK